MHACVRNICRYVSGVEVPSVTADHKRMGSGNYTQDKNELDVCTLKKF